MRRIHVAFLLLAVMWLLPFKITGRLVPAFVVVLGIIVSPISTAIFAAVPEVMDKPQWRCRVVGQGPLTLPREANGEEVSSNQVHE